MDIGTKKEPGRMLSAEEILAPAGGCNVPVLDEDPPSSADAPIGATDQPVN